MEIRTDARYQFKDRFKGESELELFNDHYLRFRSKQLKKVREFKMEVATLNPEPRQVEDIAWHWLAAAVFALCGALYSLYSLITAADNSALWTLLGLATLMLLLGGGFILAFLYRSERKWLFETRAAQYPLICIRYHKANRQEAKQFVERLTLAIESTTRKKGYSDDDLFAGEMRMLRRLSKSGVISDSIYDSAKKHMLGGNQQAAMAAAG